MHSPEFTRSGGRFHALQLWVNLPAKSKMSPPKYQTLLARDIPSLNLTGGATLRVIAGEYRGAKGPAKTFTPIDLLELRIPAGRDADLALRAGFSAALYVVQGAISVNRETAGEGELIVLGRPGSEVAVEASADAIVFVMSGEPIDEPVAGSGPFVMNTHEELEKAYRDFHSGRMGRIPQTEKEKVLS
jgi:redox-sensitive bicupin YhaK (pirin superfamily)